MAGLKKELTFRVILLITINSILGTGIFFLPAVGAKHAGPASIISWVIMAAIAVYTGMCFAELSSMFPKAGGIYEYCKQAFGRFPSFLIGWGTIIAGNITIAMLVVGAIQYIFPANIPIITVPLSLVFVFLFNFIAFRGLKTSSFMLVTFAIITLVALFSLIIPGLLKFNVGNLTPFFVFPTSAIFVTIFFVAETFFGWETATFLAEETKHGQRVMPKALILGTIIIAVIALLVVVTSLSSIPWAEFAQSRAPLTDLGMLHYGNLGEKALSMLVYLAIIGSVAGWIVAAPRLLLAMARDNLFIKQLAAIHPKYQTPHKAILFQTILTTILVFVGVGSYTTLLSLLVPLVLILYSAVLVSLVVMRFTRKKTKRYYTVPFGKTGPLLVVLFLFFLIIGWVLEQEAALQQTMLAASFILLGIPVYFLLEEYYDPKFIRKTFDILSYPQRWLENITFPKKRRHELLRHIGKLKGRIVFEYGSGVGTLTLHLAEKVGPKGKVFGTDLSKSRLKIAQRRMDKYDHKHVTLLHDPRHTTRAHPAVPKADILLSEGNLGLLKNPVRVLKRLGKKLKKGARVCFMDYDKLFWVIPNIEWLNKDESVRKVFEKAGFEVTIHRHQGIAWKYVFICGKKK